MINAVAYYRTSSATNVGDDKDSQRRQREAIKEYAIRSGITVEFDAYDAAVSGSDPIDTRPGFLALLDYCAAHDVRMILVENATRFARDLLVQMTGHALLKQRGIDLVPVDAPTYFTDPSPTAVLIQQILGAVTQFERAGLVHKLRHARDAVRANTGRCEGRKPAPAPALLLAQSLRGKQYSLRQIAAELSQAGYQAPSGNAYSASSVKCMLS